MKVVDISKFFDGRREATSNEDISAVYDVIKALHHCHLCPESDVFYIADILHTTLMINSLSEAHGSDSKLGEILRKYIVS